MNDYKMKLSDEEKDILAGAKGETMRKALESVVRYGDFFGAVSLAKVEHPIHMVTSVGVPMLKPVFSLMDELIASGLKTAYPFTVDPRPIDYDNVPCTLPEKIIFNRVMYGKQAPYERQLQAVGLANEDAFSCTCYMEEVGNIPAQGAVLAWAESSAVVYANSVLGARTNRNSGILELLCGITGRTPIFGFLTDEGRRANRLIEVKTTSVPEAQILGSAIGMKVMEDVPFIRGLDRFLGTELNQGVKDYLKDMGAATASNGAVGLYHVENLTPEAVRQGDSLLRRDHKTYVIDDAEIKRVRDSYPVMWKNPNAKPRLCFIGCPHLSYAQLTGWTERIEKKLQDSGRKRVGIRTVMTAAPPVVKRFKADTGLCNRLMATGIHLSSICPLMYMNNPLCAKKPIITNSNKLRTYTTCRYYTDEEILEAITRR